MDGQIDVYDPSDHYQAAAFWLQPSERDLPEYQSQEQRPLSLQ